MRSFLFKVLLPFVVTLAVGMALVVLIRHRQQGQQRAPNTNANGQRATAAPSPALALPEIHVLSTNLIDENMKYAGVGHTWQDLKVLTPAGVLYTKATRKDYKQGVLQVNVLFGANGEITEIKPLTKRTDCGDCLSLGNNIVFIKPDDPASHPYIEAATEAVKQINFIPCQSDGKPVPTHGFIECVFR